MAKKYRSRRLDIDVTDWTLDELQSWDTRIREKAEELGLECHPQIFEVCDEEPSIASDKDFPHHLVSNNDMFHIGSYSQRSKALVDFKPDCIAEINSQDAREIGIKSGDRVVVESSAHKVELPVEVNNITAKGQVYIPKNWTGVAVNLMRNGGKGPVSVKVAKVE